MTDTIQNPTEDLGLSHDLWERLPAISVDPTDRELLETWIVCWDAE